MIVILIVADIGQYKNISAYYHYISPLLFNSNSLKFKSLKYYITYRMNVCISSKGGAYVVNLMDKYAVGYSILVAVFLETIAVSWLYGKIWKKIVMLNLLLCVLLTMVLYERQKHHDSLLRSTLTFTPVTP